MYSLFNMMKKLSNLKAFTLVEVMISVAIFAFMTSFLLAKYGTFNQGILLTNLAYDVALTIRNAQSYGLNVKNAPVSSGGYNFPYGVHFDVNGTTIIFFADVSGVQTEITRYVIKRGSKVSQLCIGPGSCTTAVSALDVTFRRPDPNAIITGDGVKASYAEITLASTDGGQKKIVIRSTGQIAILN